jgi:cytochrome c oxidase subunit II
MRPGDGGLTVSTRDEFDSLFSLYLPVAIVVFVLVTALIGYTLVRYRRREGRESSRRSSMPVLEISLAVVIAGIAAVLLTRTFTTEADVDRVTESQVKIRVVAFQWGWRFDYLGDHVRVAGNSNSPPTFAVPVGQQVEFSVTSRDVIHSFWVPEERFKRDVFPARTSQFDLTFDSPGLNDGRCAEYCGLRHDAMSFNVLVLPESQFKSWLADRKGGGGA